MAPIFSFNMDFIFDPLVALDPNPQNPMLTVFFIGCLVSLFIVVLQKLLIDYDKMEAMQEQSKELQKELRAAQQSGDPKALAKVQKKQMEFLPQQTELMKMQFKPTIITMVPILLVFGGMYANHAISTLTIHIASAQHYLLLMPIWNMFWPMPDLTINFFGWYLLVSFTMSFVLRIMLGLKTM